MKDAWFTVLRYSPDPEQKEYINVALLIWDGDKGTIIYDENFPRFTALFDLNTQRLSSYLDALSFKIAAAFSASEVWSTVEERAPQVKAFSFRNLTYPVESQYIEVLKNKYLSHPRIGNQK